jgi:kynurenine formamidase
MNLVYGQNSTAAECGANHAVSHQEPPEEQRDGEARVQAAEAASETVAKLMVSSTRIADLTHQFGEDFPVLEPYVLKPVISHFANLQNRGFNANKLEIDEHTGTHMDGPAHLDDQYMFTADIPVTKLVAPLVVIRIHERAANDPNATLTAQDVRAWESRHGRIPPGAFVAMDSGWARRVPVAGAYINRDTAGNPHFPGLGFDAVEFLVNQRSIVGAGTDTPSLDAGVNLRNPMAHRQLLGPNGRYGIENIANLGAVPGHGGMVVVGVTKQAHGYAGPVRLLAFI